MSRISPTTGTTSRPGSGGSETTATPTVDHTLEFDWDASPYTFRDTDEDDIRGGTGGRGTPIILRDTSPPNHPPDVSLTLPSFDATDGQELPPGPAVYRQQDVVFSLPPVSHTGDIHGVLFPTHTDGYAQESESESEDEDDVVLIENKSVRDERTLFGRAFSKATVPASLSISANKEDANNAAKAINKITKKPLGPIWHAATQIFFILIFLANLIVTAIDVAEDTDPLRFKIPDLVLSVFENIFLVTLWFIFKFKYKNKEKTEQANFLKFQQYFENTLHELLLYPTIIIATLGFVEEKMYETPDSAMGWIQLILLIVDVLDLLFAQGMRMYMIYRFFQDIQTVIDPNSRGCCGSTIGARLLPRTFFTIVGNTLLFLMLIFVMGCQMNYENLSDQINYSISYKSGLQMIVLIIFPIYSVFMFCVANSYWVLEFLIQFNLKLSQSKELREKVMEAGEQGAEALTFASEKVTATKERLTSIQEMQAVQKLMYGLSEVYVILLVFIWEAMVLAVVLTFDAFQTEWFNWGMRLTFAALSIVVNSQVMFLALSVNVVVPFVTASMLCYPCAVMVCFRVKTNDINDEEVVVDDDALTTGEITLKTK